MVVERRNGELVSLGVLIQSATATTGMTASKDAAKSFEELLKTLRGET